MAFLVISVGVVSAQEKLDRTHLPIQEPKRATYSELDVRNVKDKPPFFAVTAPKNAPNVVIVLIDDIGFGGPSTFGGPIQTPTLDKLAKGGLKFNNFHTTALCSPTRMALKTGRNHHTANTGSIMESSTGFPGNTGQVPNSVAPLAEMLRLNGYSSHGWECGCGAGIGWDRKLIIWRFSCLKQSRRDCLSSHFLSARKVSSSRAWGTFAATAFNFGSPILPSVDRNATVA